MTGLLPRLRRDEPGVVGFTHGRELEEGHLHSKGIRTMIQIIGNRQQATDMGEKRVYNRAGPIMGEYVIMVRGQAITAKNR